MLDPPPHPASDNMKAQRITTEAEAHRRLKPSGAQASTARAGITRDRDAELTVSVAVFGEVVVMVNK